MKIIFLASTNGSVLNKLLSNGFLLNNIDIIISDRECGAIELAKKFNINFKILESKSGQEFSDYLLKEYPVHDNHLFISFYTRLLKGDFLNVHKNRIINLHPSILPACPGMDGFGDTIKSGAKFIGSTVHFIDSGIDTGLPIIQSSIPYNPNISVAENRHKIFIQQCKMLVQVIEWFIQRRIVVNSEHSVTVCNAEYKMSEFVPNLDFNDSIKELN